MHKQLLENPVKVLKNFYKTCNVEYSFHEVINIETLRNALIELQRENFSSNLIVKFSYSHILFNK